MFGGKHLLCFILQEPSRAMVFHYLRWSDYVDQGLTRQPPARSPAIGDILSRVGLVVRLSCSALRHSFTTSTAQGVIDALHGSAQRGLCAKRRRSANDYLNRITYCTVSDHRGIPSSANVGMMKLDMPHWTEPKIFIRLR